MVTTDRHLLSGSWKADVLAVESAVADFGLDGPMANDCHVAFFEIAGDKQLHVNVTHRYETTSPRGWAGPGRLRTGFVYNRRFSDARHSQVTRKIRDMVFADRIDSPAVRHPRGEPVK